MGHPAMLGTAAPTTKKQVEGGRWKVEKEEARKAWEREKESAED